MTTEATRVGAPPPTDEYTDRKRWAALVVLAAALALDAGSVAIVNAALPKISADLNMGGAALQWIMTAYAVAFAGFLLLGGRAADVLGRRMVFTVGVAVFAAGSLGAAVAPNSTSLILARGAQGLGAALSGPPSLALVTQLFPEGPLRNKALSRYTAVGASSFSLGLVLGGVLTDAMNWRAVFALNAIIAAGVLLAIRRTLPRGHRQPQHLDLPGCVLITGGLVLIVLGLSRAGDKGWSDATVWIEIAASAVLIVAFFIWEHRSRDPLLPTSLLRPPTVRAATLCACIFYAALIGLLFFAPQYMQGLLGYSPLQSGLAIVPMGILVSVSANVSAKLLGRISARTLMVSGLTLIAIGVAMWAFTPLHGNYWLNMFPAICIMSWGQGTAFAAMTVASLTGVPQDHHGVAGGLNVTAQQVGAGVGTACLVALAHSWNSGHTPQAILSSEHAAYTAAAIALAVAAVWIAVSPLLSRLTGGGSALATASADQPAVQIPAQTPATQES